MQCDSKPFSPFQAVHDLTTTPYCSTKTERQKCGLRDCLTFPDNDQIEHTEVGIDKASTDRLAFALASTTRAVAGVSLAEQQTHAASGQHTLLHGKSLLVVSTADAHNIALQ